MKKGARIALSAGIVAVAAAVALYALRGKIFPGPQGAAGGEAAYSLAKLARGDVTLTVSASGKLEPQAYVTVRPDPNLPTRRLARVLVAEGERVRPGQALAEIDRSGLDLDLLSARAGYDAQKVKLASLQANPTTEELAAARATLEEARGSLENARQDYESTKSLAEKNLASRNQLASAERQVTVAAARLEAAERTFETVQAGTAAEVLRAQEAAVAEAESALAKARLILESATVRAPLGGVVTNILVRAGDLVGSSTALMSVADMERMRLQADVNEGDVGQVAVGQTATVTAAGYPDEELAGKVIGLELTAEQQGNVSVFKAVIEVPNRDGRLLWGMSADAEIQVMDRQGVLTLPSGAVQAANGAAHVLILDGGELVSWEVLTGANDGSRTEIVAGLAEGDEVAVLNRKANQSSGQSQRGQAGFRPPGMFQLGH